MSSRQRWSILVALVLAHALADVTTLLKAYEDHWPKPVVTCALALVLSQVGVVAVWAALGPGTWVVRLPLLVFTCAGLSLALGGPRIEGGNLLIWGAFVTIEAAVVFLPLLLVRSLGLRIDLVCEADAGQLDRTEFQFSIKHMFGWTLAVAVLLGLARLLRISPQHEDSIADSQVWLTVLVLSLSFATVVLIAAWPVYGSGRLIWRLPLSGAGVLLVGLIPPLTINHLSDNEGEFVALAALEGFLLCASLCVLRICGYRLQRLGRSPFAQSTARTPQPSQPARS
jgi:hypothetical protein